MIAVMKNDLIELYSEGVIKSVPCCHQTTSSIVPTPQRLSFFVSGQNSASTLQNPEPIHEQQMRVFLEEPDVPPDINHLERALRCIPIGRKNFLFCWTELGGEHVGIVQSLLVTCRLQGIDPYRYLVDVLQRISLHPARQVDDLIPRNWKERFGDNLLKALWTSRGRPPLYRPVTTMKELLVSNIDKMVSVSQGNLRQSCSHIV